MPQGKNASYRYRIIDQALRNKGRRWSYLDLIQHVSEKLAEEFDIEKGISQRQFDDDLRIMRKDPPEGFGAPIIRKDGDIYYEDPDYSINDNPLIDTDIDSLNEILRLIKPFQALPHFHELETIIGKVKGIISQNEGEEIIMLDHNPDTKGLNHLEGLYNHIKNEKAIAVEYQPFKLETPYKQLIHPYLIKEYNNRWFLLGWDPEKLRYTIFALDRIVSLKESKEEINYQKKEELLSYQKSIIGVSFVADCQPYEIKLWVTLEQLSYLITKPLHSSQKLIEQDGNGAILTYSLMLNYELEQAILKFGEKVKVISPEMLKEKIKCRLRDAYDNYR